MLKPLLLASAGIVCAASPGAAHAQDYGPLVVSAVEATCGDNGPDRQRTPGQLAEALLTSAGILPSRIIRAGGSAGADGRFKIDDLPAASLRLMRTPTLLDPPTASRLRALASTANGLLLARSQPLGKKISVSGVHPPETIFTSPDALLTCAAVKPEPVAGSGKSPADDSKGPPLIVVRGKVDDFPLGVKASPSSFQASYARERSSDLSGDNTTTKTLSVRGAIGIRFAGDVDDTYLFGYGDYALNHVRKSTSPTPTPAANNGSAKDVNALELGFFGSTRLPGDAIRLSGRLGAVLDFKADARRLAGGLKASLIGDDIIGSKKAPLCGFGLYSESVLGLPVEGKCSAALRLDLSQVLDRGTANFGPESSIVAAGGEIGFEIRPQAKTQPDGSVKVPDGFVGSVTYRYQAMLFGSIPDIDRVDATLKYRWWAADQVAFDLGLTYADGTETKSFADENRLMLSFGILF